MYVYERRGDGQFQRQRFHFDGLSFCSKPDILFEIFQSNRSFISYGSRNTRHSKNFRLSSLKNTCRYSVVPDFGILISNEAVEKTHAVFQTSNRLPLTLNCERMNGLEIKNETIHSLLFHFFRLESNHDG